ncbi:MAG: EAL domain-containing protein, partial [Egibacteraceae bacterium]
MTRLRVVVADDLPQVRTALCDLLATDPAIEVVGTASDATEVIAQCAALTPDVVVMDVKMPGGGITATRTIRGRHPETRVVAFSAYEDRSSVLEMLGAGATGYVTKGSPPAEIIAAVRQAGQGLSMLSPMASAELVQELGTRVRLDERHAADRRRGVERIEAAIDGDLRMVFQPIVDLSSGRLAGVEALARFGGQPPQTPDVWFAEAAQLGLGSPLERAAFGAALPALDRLPEGAYLSVNLSPAVVMEPGFWDDVPPSALGRLVLELTEHAAIHDYQRLRDVLAPLRARGMRLAVDDAGAGFASLRHILLLDADLIKIDITLIRDLHVDRARRAMTSALITFATETRAMVIAEGIEQADELASLRALGAAFGQGYLIARPASLDELDLGAGPLLPAVSHRPANGSSGAAGATDAR